MPNILEILTSAKSTLKAAGVDSAFLDAELLMAHILGKTREFVVGRPEYELSENEEKSFAELLPRRQEREPLAKIIGKKEFWGREFLVNGSTLDPRPDSEALIEAVCELFPNHDEALKIIDLGTGSGCLLLTILAEYPQSLGIGVDIADTTLDVAKRNAEKLGLAKRCDFILNDWAEGLNGKFDLIISNPPYIKNSDIHNLAREVSGYEPRLALEGGGDGLECYKVLFPQIKTLLNKNGKIVFEFGKGQEMDVKEILEQSGMRFVSFKSDLSGAPRCIIAE